MRIIIDGDATPDISNITELAKENTLEILIFCDFSHNINSEYANVINVDTRSQSVDVSIINNALKNDIIITQDYGLAAILLSRDCFVINPNGNIYTNDNIDFLLQNRYLNLKSKHIKGPKKRSKQDSIKLIESLKKVIYGNNNFRNNTRNS